MQSKNTLAVVKLSPFEYNLRRRALYTASLRMSLPFYFS